MDNYDKAVDFISEMIDTDEIIELAKETSGRFDIDIKVVLMEMIVPEIESLIEEFK